MEGLKMLVQKLKEKIENQEIVNEIKDAVIYSLEMNNLNTNERIELLKKEIEILKTNLNKNTDVLQLAVENKKLADENKKIQEEKFLDLATANKFISELKEKNFLLSQGIGLIVK